MYRALVNNHAKLAYRSVAAWLDGKDQMPEKIAKVKGLDEQLRMQDQIAQVMKSVRYLHGALDLETIEPEAVLRDGQPRRISPVSPMSKPLKLLRVAKRSLTSKLVPKGMKEN